MNATIESLFKDLPNLHLDHISVCFTLRERSSRAKRLWLKRKGFPLVHTDKLSNYWKSRAVEDPEVARRLLGLYLEYFSKSGDPNKIVDCMNSSLVDYSIEDLERLLNSPGPHLAKSVRSEISRALGATKKLPPDTEPPPLMTRVASASSSLANWAASGFKGVSGDELERRKSICVGCEFWDPAAFQGTGKCLKCGCSTWAKLQMASESCPVGKWGAIRD